MLHSLVIKNFRCLEDFSVEKLGRVNLIVGKNNSGKSTVLEALRIYAGNAHPKLLEDIAQSHDEKYKLNGREGLEPQTTMPFEDLFTGRKFPYNYEKQIIIGEFDNEDKLQIEHSLVLDLRESVANDESIRHYHAAIKNPSSGFVVLTEKKTVDRLCIKKGKKEYEIDFYSTQQNSKFILSDIIPCNIIPTQFISVTELENDWANNIAGTTENEEILKKAMCIILPEFENIYFLPSTDKGRIIKVKLSNHPRPVPLKSLGDGMTRILQLALKLVSAQGGFLLIDEFENGLHYSTQEKIWSWLFEVAEQLDIQVFATTHSWDCIESFATVANEKENIEAVLFRMGRSAKKSNQGQIIATVFDKEKLFNVTQADIEIR